MKLNQAGIDLIKRFEQCKLQAYPDPGDPNGPWTIGWGSTGSDINKDTVWTQQQADERFLKDAFEIAEEVNRLIATPIWLNENQFSALVSFAYNCGADKLEHSTLMKCINKGSLDQVPTQLARWNKNNGKVLNGLVKRRQAEADLFMLPIT